MEQKEYFFEKLTPNDEVDISVYDEAMEFVFDNSDITNIAISGAYGAGKSSVIDSYKKNILIKSLCIFLWHILNLLTSKMRQML